MLGSLNQKRGTVTNARTRNGTLIRPASPVRCMGRPKKLVSELLEAAVPPNVITARRPDLLITKEMAEAIGEAVKANGGELILPLSTLVKQFNLSLTYANTNR